MNLVLDPEEHTTEKINFYKCSTYSYDFILKHPLFI